MLPFIFMDPFDMQVADAVRKEFHVLSHLYERGKTLLGSRLDLLKFSQGFLIVRERFEILQARGVKLVVVPYFGADPVGQFGIAAIQPAAERNPVCLVAEFLRVDLIKSPELGFLQDLRVDLRDAVHGKSEMDAQVGHMDSPFRVNDPHGRVMIFVLDDKVQSVNDRYELRHHFGELIDRPCLKRLRQDRMVRIGAGTGHYFDRLHKGQSLIVSQDADQLRDDQRRMRIVDLDDRIVVHPSQVAFARFHLAKDLLRRAAYQKILLIQAKDLPRLIGIIRIYE